MSDNSQNALVFMYMITRFRVHKGIFFLKKSKTMDMFGGLKKQTKKKINMDDMLFKKKRGGESQKSQLCKHVSIRNASKFGI